MRRWHVLSLAAGLAIGFMWPGPGIGSASAQQPKAEASAQPNPFSGWSYASLIRRRDRLKRAKLDTTEIDIEIARRQFEQQHPNLENELKLRRLEERESLIRQREAEIENQRKRLQQQERALDLREQEIEARRQTTQEIMDSLADMLLKLQARWGSDQQRGGPASTQPASQPAVAR